MKSTIPLHRAWRRRLIEGTDPQRYWGSRVIQIRHGRYGSDAQYPAVLRHPSDRDPDLIFQRARTLSSLPLSLRKAAGGEDDNDRDLPAGGRWITVHPNGDEEEGHPVYIVPNPDGSHTIVRGAGGALNGLRLDHVKSEAEYKELAKQRRKEKQQEQKLVEDARRQKLGDEEYRADQERRAAAALEAQRAQQQTEWEFVKTVADLQGVSHDDLEVPDEALEGVDPRIAQKVRERNRQAWVSWAREVAERTKAVVHDAYEGLTSDAVGDLAVEDVASENTGDLGRGYQAHLDAMAAERGLTPQDRRRAQADVSWRGFLERSDLDVREAARRQAAVQSMHAAAAATRAEVKQVEGELQPEGVGAAAARQAERTPKVETLGDAVKVLSAMKKAERARKEAAQYSKQVREVEDASKLPKAAVVVGKELTDEEALAAVARTLTEEHLERAVRPLVEQTNVMDAQQGTMREHYSVGQVAAFGAIGQAVSGANVDPVAVDILGPSGVAAALATGWRESMSSAELEGVKKALKEQHIATQSDIANAAMQEAQRWLEEADKAGEAEASHTDDLAGALVQHARKVECLSRARQAAGVARGRLEAAAALNDALMGAPGNVQISMGSKSVGDVVRDLAALGLTEQSIFDPETNDMIEERQYTISSDGKNRIVTLHAAGLRELAQQMAAPSDVRERASRTAAIKSGAEDDPEWVPAGISRRPTTTFDMEPLERRSIQNSMVVSNEDTAEQMAQALQQHIGERINAGQDPWDVQADVWSASFAAGLGLDDEAMGRWQQALREVVPHFRADKGLTPGAAVEAFEAHRQSLRQRMEGYAENYVEQERAAGRMSDDDAALHRQRISVDETSRDCLYTAVLADPRTQYALHPVGHLGREGREAVRSWAYEHLFHIDPKSEDVIEPLTHDERRVFDEWQDLKRSGDPYAAIQEAMRRKASEVQEDIFGEKPDVDPIANVDLNDNASVLAYARAHPKALGYTPVAGVEGPAAYPELQAGETWSTYDDGGNRIDHAARTEETIAQDVRRRVRASLRAKWLREHVNAPELADRDYNPDQVHLSNDRWSEYVRDMGGERRAYATVQELMAGDLVQRFSAAYQQRTGKALSVVEHPVTAAQSHVVAMLPPEARASARQSTKGEQARLQQGSRGRFQAGEVKEKLEASQQLQREQPKLFGSEEAGALSVNVHRATAGRAVEGALRSMLPYVDVSRPVEAAGNVKLAPEAQRAVKLIMANRRQGVNLQAGAGKTLVAISAFTQLRHEGKARRALFLVPSNIIGDFGGQFYKFVDPETRLRWHADPGATPDERRAALGDENTHAVVMTLESLREDVTRAVAEDLGITPQEAVKRMEGMEQDEVDSVVHAAMDKRGWHFDYLVSDEGHRTLGRAGKPDAHMARIADSAARAANYYVYSTADPVKNDASEVWSALNKIDPKRYGPETREPFIRRYGRNTSASRVALQREIAPYLYATRNSIGGVQHERSLHVIPMSEEQHREYSKRVNAYRRLKAARARGKVDVQAAKELYPRAFEGQVNEQVVAERIARAATPIREAALNEVTNLHERGAKVDWVSRYAAEHKGEPMIVFAHNRKAVKLLQQRLRAEGHRVGILRGDMSATAKDQARMGFSPPAGEPRFDILVSSDAGAMGANLQRGYHLINFDSPMTAMTYEQRIAREVRRGQQNAVSVHDLVHDNDYDRRARQRLEDKGGLRDTTTTPSELIDDSGLMARLEAERERTFRREYERPRS